MTAITPVDDNAGAVNSRKLALAGWNCGTARVLKTLSGI